MEIPVTWVGRERRFSTLDIDAMKAGPAARERLEGLYVRGSGSAGQESSLAAQDAELCASSTGTASRVFKDRACGLREQRAGLDRFLIAVAAGEATVVRATHEHRLARFAAGWLRQLLTGTGPCTPAGAGQPGAAW